MDTAKIRIKIGDNEFEAEGTMESVNAQFDAFRTLLAAIPPQAAKGMPEVKIEAFANKEDAGSVGNLNLNRIMRAVGRVVSLTAIPSSTEDAALLLMLGHKELRDSESVTGQEIGDGLAQSGRPVDRVDRLLASAIHEAYVLKVGIKRSTRYRLTNSGHQKAIAVASELIASLP